jgi:phage-related protein
VVGVGEVADLFVILRAETAPFMRGMKAAAAEGETMTTRMGGVGKVFNKIGEATTLAAVGITVASVKMASDFETETNVLVTAAGEVPAALGKVRDGILSISSSTGTSWKQVTDGMYQAEKAGFSFAKGGLDVVRAAAQGAREEGAPLNDVVNAMTTVMKNYNIPASKSVQVMNAMKTGAGEAKTTFALFSSSLSTVLPIAYATHISLGDIVGSLATMTQRGETAQHGAQLLAGAIGRLQKPNATTISTLNQLGLSSQKVSQDMGTKGLSGVMNEIVAAITTKLGPSGLYAAGVLKTSAQAAQSATAMLGAMPPGLKSLAQGFQNNTVTLGSFKKAIKSMPADQAAMATQFMALIEKSKGFSDGVKAGNGPLTTFSDLLGKATGGQTGLQTALLLTGANAGDTKTNIDKVNASLGDGTKDVEGWKSTSQLLSVQMAKLRQTADSFAIQLGMKLIPVIQSVISFFAQHKAMTEALAVAIGVVLGGSVIKFLTGALTPYARALVGVGKGLKAFAESQKVAAAATKIMTVAQAAFDAVMDANPVILIVLAIIALVGVLVYAYYHCETFRKIVQAAFRAVAEAAMAVWRAVQPVWNGLVAGVVWLWHALESAWRSIASVTAAVWNGIIAFFRKWWPLLLVIFLPVVAAVISIWNHFHKQIIGTAVAVWSAVASFFVAVWKSIVNTAKAAWLLFQVCIVRPVQAVWAFLQPAIHSVESFLSGAWHAILAVGSAVWNSLKTAIINPIQQAWTALVGIGGKIISAISGAFHSALNAVADVGSWFLNIGDSIVMGIIHGIEGAAGALFDTLKNLAGNALNAAKNFLGINSPSKVFADHVGMAIPEGIAKGVNDHAALAHRAVTALSVGLVASGSGGMGSGAAFAIGGPGGFAAASGSGGSPPTIVVQVDGKTLFEIIQTRALRYGRRNPTTGVVYH